MTRVAEACPTTASKSSSAVMTRWLIVELPGSWVANGYHLRESFQDHRVARGAS